MNRFQDRHRHSLALAVAVGLSIAGALVGSATANKPIQVPSDPWEVNFSTGFTPTVLSKTRPTPVALFASWRARPFGGVLLPPLRELVFDIDRNAAINLKGHPACNRRLDEQGAIDADQFCRGTQIGKGRVAVSVAFPELEEIHASTRLVIFDGGGRNGVRTLYAYAALSAPVSTTILVVGKIRKAPDGRYGTEVAFSFPRIAGGSGSVTYFSMVIDKEYTYEGRRVSVVTMKCPRGRILSHGEAILNDGHQISEDMVRSCTSSRRPGRR